MTPPQTNISPWWRPHRHQDRRPFLLARSRMAAAARAFFGAQDFVEFDPAILQISPGNEVHIKAFKTEILDGNGANLPLYLHTSPEFAAKKLLSAGESRLFAFTHVFRNQERGPLHHPEFTLLEWYRAAEPYQKLIEDCMGLLASTVTTTGSHSLAFAGHVSDPFRSPEILTVAEAFERYCGLDLVATLSDAEKGRELLAEGAQTLGLRVTPDDSWRDIFSKILSAKIEPHLGHGRPTFLIDYPAAEAALAQLQEDSRFAERFELYACGVELANGFGELRDADIQRCRFEAAEALRLQLYGETYPIDEDFLAALSIMPPASGIALGFDRLVMLATGAAHIEQVVWTPLPGSVDV